MGTWKCTIIKQRETINNANSDKRCTSSWGASPGKNSRHELIGKSSNFNASKVAHKRLKSGIWQCLPVQKIHESTELSSLCSGKFRHVIDCLLFCSEPGNNLHQIRRPATKSKTSITQRITIRNIPRTMIKHKIRGNEIVRVKQGMA